MALLLITISITGLFAVYVYGKTQLQEQEYRRLALIVAQSELDVWRAQSEYNFHRTHYFNAPHTELTFFDEDNNAVTAEIIRDCNGPHTEIDQQNGTVYEYYNVWVTVRWRDSHLSKIKNQQSEVTLEARFGPPSF